MDGGGGQADSRAQSGAPVEHLSVRFLLRRTLPALHPDRFNYLFPSQCTTNERKEGWECCAKSANLSLTDCSVAVPELRLRTVVGK